jgi:dTDP-4-dehydrorhamnose reductase
MKPLLLGHNGILGKRIQSIIDCDTTLFRFPSEEFVNLIINKQYRTIINCIVDKQGNKTINIDLPCFLKENTKQLIHFCTDAVFSGDKTIGLQYTKKDPHDPTDEYGLSKSIASKYLLRESNILVIRTSFLDIRSQLVQKLSCVEEFTGYSNYYWNGLTAKQVAHETKKLIQNNSNGLYYLFGNTTYSKYDLANIIRNFLNRPTKIISVELDNVVNRSLRSDFPNLNFDINQL